MMSSIRGFADRATSSHGLSSLSLKQLMAGAMLALAVAALPATAALPAASARSAPLAAAEDDPQGVDCFFAENRDDPLCRETVFAAAPRQRPVAPPQSVPAQDDDDGVDCFFAENRENQLCRGTL